VYLYIAKHKSHNAPGGSDAYGKRIIIYLVKFSFLFLLLFVCYRLYIFGE